MSYIAYTDDVYGPVTVAGRRPAAPKATAPQPDPVYGPFTVERSKPHADAERFTLITRTNYKTAGRKNHAWFQALLDAAKEDGTFTVAQALAAYPHRDKGPIRAEIRYNLDRGHIRAYAEPVKIRLAA